MMTVLIKYRSTKREVLYTASNVEYVPHETDVYLPGLLINFPNGDCRHIGVSTSSDDVRDIFVMNEHGKTVARYDL